MAGDRVAVLPIILTAALVGFKAKAKPAQRGGIYFSEPRLDDVYRYVYRRTETETKTRQKSLKLLLEVGL